MPDNIIPQVQDKYFDREKTLWLPTGSIRALIAIILVLTISLLSIISLAVLGILVYTSTYPVAIITIITSILMGFLNIVSLAIGFYFGNKQNS